MFNIFKKKKFEFLFDMPRNTMCFSCCHVVEDSAPILYVSHDIEGDWQFLCGASHASADVKIIGIGEVVDRDQSINLLHEMPEGVAVTRESISHKWIRVK